ncbi:MAG: hypothetical protein A2020_06395 [Lentisphaerae bacterium GWF2_45_14]|nr:MAG: hypothetical protein A2020_06395 [Lentisphaerae bacterium GWF2_45_14]
MLDSDAPQPIKERIYIPQEHSRKISQSEEAHDDGGGGFSYIFHEKGGHNPDGQENDKAKHGPVDIGDAVEVHLSGGAVAKQSGEETQNETQPIPEKSEKEDKAAADKNKGSGEEGGEKRRINITV